MFLSIIVFPIIYTHLLYTRSACLPNRLNESGRLRPLLSIINGTLPLTRGLILV